MEKNNKKIRILLCFLVLVEKSIHFVIKMGTESDGVNKLRPLIKLCVSFMLQERIHCNDENVVKYDRVP